MDFACISAAVSPQIMQRPAGIQGPRGILILLPEVVIVLARSSALFHVPFSFPLPLREWGALPCTLANSAT